MNEKMRKLTTQEAKILEVLCHPNIVRFREVYRNKRGMLNIVMDYCDNGTLECHLNKMRQKNKETGQLKYLSEETVLNNFT